MKITQISLDYCVIRKTFQLHVVTELAHKYFLAESPIFYEAVEMLHDAMRTYVDAAAPAPAEIDRLECLYVEYEDDYLASGLLDPDDQELFEFSFAKAL